MSLVTRVRQDPRLLAAVLVGGGAVLALLLYLFQPWQLFIDTTVDEALPTVGPVDPEGVPVAGDERIPDEEMSPDETMSEDMPADGPVVLRSGEFGPRSHPGSGTASLYELEDGSRVLRFEDLATDNGPDLFVYLSTAPPDAPAGSFEDDFVNLGRLKGNLGDQNYAVPDDVDLDRYTTVAIWCDRFTVVFTTAALRVP